MEYTVRYKNETKERLSINADSMEEAEKELQIFLTEEEFGRNVIFNENVKREELVLVENCKKQNNSDK